MRYRVEAGGRRQEGPTAEKRSTVDIDPELKKAIAKIVDIVLEEDLGPDFVDLTSQAVVGTERAGARITANEPGVVCGLVVAEAVFKRLDPDAEWKPLVAEGEKIMAGQTVAQVTGRLAAILTGERAALNFLSHLSGVASLTRRYVNEVAGTGAQIFDTRKTLPGLRSLEKYAVRLGGGHNHRFGLYDGILIKDNHLVGRRLSEVVLQARAGTNRSVEVEVDTLDQLKEALSVQPDVVLLDNMDIDTLKKAVALAKGKVEIEVSGGVRLNTVRQIAQAGAERISIGSITQGPPLDFSLAVVAPTEAADGCA